ncbi:hypothetical protein OC835_000670 [Tilletia horrida]|nr:hypothetical protein OC835_000670 [Tilletia horrida]
MAQTTSLPAGEYRIRTADGRVIGRNFFEDRSMLPKRIVVHPTFEERIDVSTRWTWTPSEAEAEAEAAAAAAATGEAGAGTLTVVGWKAGAHEGKIKAHYYTDWIEDETREKLMLVKAGASAAEEESRGVYVVSASGTTFWAIAEAEGDVLAHVVAVQSKEKAVTFVFERLQSQD